MKVCRYCVDDVEKATIRKDKLTDLLLLADRQLFPSAFFRELCIANGLPAEHCFVNKNGIGKPGPGYFEKRRKKRGSAPALRLRRRPRTQQGRAADARAFRSLKRNDYELVIVDAAQNAGHSWRHMIDWSVPGRLRFHPAYNKDTMDEFFAQIDVLLFPSQWKESFGLTVREALRRDVWVIATDAGGVAEDCRPGVNSTIIPMTTDHLALAKAIADVLDDSRMKDFVNPAREDVRLVSEQADELDGYLKDIMKQKEQA